VCVITRWTCLEWFFGERKGEGGGGDFMCVFTDSCTGVLMHILH